ncbi:MAG: Crp/Fnr family transcriptional regulator [Gammaproteobacteria bacterium]
MDNARVLALDEGERLFDFGQPGERFFFVVAGMIKLYRVSPEGNEKIIELIGPGKLFAEAVMFMQQRHYPVSAEALRPTTLYSFDNQTFTDLLRSSNELCFALLGDLSMRLHARLNEIDYLTLQNATFRVVSYLIDALPDPKAESAVIDLNAPKQLIASQLSITPETFSRILHTLAREGIVTIHGKTIGVHNTERLRKFVHSSQISYAGSQR